MKSLPSSNPDPTRRLFCVGLSSLFATAALVGSASAESLIEITELRPGEFTWHPDRQPHGPLAIIVSIPQQRVHVYRNGLRIAVSTCSTGKAGHETPTGVFVILEKDKNHKSSTYNDAPMPNMNRLTWSGIALHAGNLPGYPASHGCVRLPLGFSANLFSITRIGTPVVIAGAKDAPQLINPGMVLGSFAQGQLASASAGTRKPAKADANAPVVSAVASATDGKILLIKNGSVIAEGALTVSGQGKLGSHVYMLEATGPNGALEWVDIGRVTTVGGQARGEDHVLSRVRADRRFVDMMQPLMSQGMILVLTDAPLHPSSRSGKDFVIMS